jgi:hypothetical protein
MVHVASINCHCVIHMHPGKSLVACVVLLHHVHGARSCALCLFEAFFVLEFDSSILLVNYESWLGITINRIVKFAVFFVILLNNARFRVISALYFALF